MANMRSTAAGGLDNSITALLTQLSEDNREIEARLSPQAYEAAERTAKRDWSMVRAWLKSGVSKQP